MLRIQITVFFIIGTVSLLFSQKEQFHSSELQINHIETLNQQEHTQNSETKTATILSIILPGAGQIYNKNYWKPALIWGGIAVSLYISQVNRELYTEFKNEYILELGYPKTQSKYHDYNSLSNIKAQKNLFKRRMETAYIFAGAIYLLQILDANVDAQLMTFDVSDNLSLNLTPKAYPNLIKPSPTMGLTLCVGLR